MKYFKETEKAVQLRLTVEDFDTEEILSKFVWVPKSQLTEDGRPSMWITAQKAKDFYSFNRSESQYETTWMDAEGNEFKAGMSAREKEEAERRAERFAQGVDSYNKLVEDAKKMGVKGIRKGMKRTTIERKIQEFKDTLSA